MIAFITCIVIGAVLGSLVAAVIDRAARRSPLFAPPPHCAACGTFLRPWDNVPVVAWVLLRGRCRHCAAFIPLGFFALELCGALAGAAVALHFER